jgi:hypothetical protein
MLNLGEHLCTRGENSPAPELMMRMMDCMAVDRKMAASIDGGLAWYAARTKCIFCRDEVECRRWLEEPEAFPEFCPNAKFFWRCAAGYVRDRASVARVQE